MNALTPDIPADPMISLSDVVKTYKIGNESVNALDGVSLDIQKNEFLAIIGSSGSGKSTLMHILGLMDRPSAGQFTFEGKDITHLPSVARTAMRATKLGFIFQSFNLLPRLNILENVLLPAHYARVSPPPDQNDALNLLTQVGMEHRAKHLPKQLSGGERQRVAIARALINKPSLILADEPTGNLDSQNMQKMMALFETLHHNGNTLILVTHDDHVAAYAKTFVRLHDGKITERGQIR